jgi:hypothetical protein
MFLEYFPLISKFIRSKLDTIKNVFACSKHSKSGQSLFSYKCTPFVLKIEEDFNIDD